MTGNNEAKQYGLVFLPEIAALPGGNASHVDRLAKAVPALEWKLCKSNDEFSGLLPQAAAVLVWSFPAKLNSLAGNLRLLSTPSAGRELIRAEPRPGLDIVFGSFHGELMAETLIGMMLAFSRGIFQSLEPLRNGEWPRKVIGDAVKPIKGSHVVVLGFGNIGKKMGSMLKPFGVRLTGINRANLDRPEYFDADDCVATLDELDTVLPKADHLVMILPGDTGTDNIIDARRLSLLQPHAYVYNLGRGNSLELDALVRMLDEGRLAGAGLDVFPVEPLPADAPVRRCPKVIMTPHTSAFGPNYFDLYIDEVVPLLTKMFS